MRAYQWEDILIEVLRVEREARERIAQEMALKQLGELWAIHTAEMDT